MVGTNKKKRILVVFYMTFFLFVIKQGNPLKQQDLFASKFFQQQSSVQQQYAPVPSYNTNSSR